MKKINKILLELYNDRKQILFLSFLGYISYLVEGLIPSDPNVIQASGLIIGASVVVGGALTAYGASKGAAAADRAAEQAAKNQRQANKIAKAQLAFQKDQQRKLDEQKDVYRAMEFENPYANMENAYEDMTVNQQQAQFEAQQGQQQGANIMQGLRGTAGASGIAGLAQAMANQGQLQTQRISASIGMQESQQQMRKAQGAAAVGAAQANIQGQQAANYYGMASQGMGMIGSGVAASDRKLKYDINLIGQSPSGLNIYTFKYKDTSHGDGVYEGVIADEALYATIKHPDGYDMVDYGMIDVNFKKIN